MTPANVQDRPRHFTVSGSATVVSRWHNDHIYEFEYQVTALDVPGVIGAARPIIEADAVTAAGIEADDYRVIITRFSVQGA